MHPITSIAIPESREKSTRGLTAPSTGAAISIASLVALLLFLPTFGAGFFGDDFVLLETLRGLAPCSCQPFDLYRYSTGNAHDVAALVRDGFFPWWTAPDFKVALFRPLTSATLVLDYAWFGASPSGYHLHSLAWFIALTIGVGLVFRSSAFLGRYTGLATVLFAMDQTHWLTVAWVANRHALISATFSMFALAAYLRWRTHGWKAGRWFSLLSNTCALLAGESGLQCLCFLVAYELFEANDSWRARVRAVLPFLALVSVYALLYRHWGYGASAAGAYVDPVADIARFWRRASVIAPAMLAELSFGVEVFYMLRAPGPVVFWAVTVLTSLTLALLYIHALLKRPDLRRGLWLVVASLLSIVAPIASQRDPLFTSRSLMLPSVGAAVAISSVLFNGYSRLRAQTATGRSGKLWVVPCAVLAVVSLIVKPLTIPLLVSKYAEAQKDVARKAEEIATGGAERAVVLLTPASYLTGYAPLAAHFRRADRPQQWWNLSWAPARQTLLRTGDRTLELTLHGGTMLQHDFEQFYRSSERPLHAGESVGTRLMQIEVKTANEQGPTSLAVTFDRSIADPSLLFLAWSGDRLRPVKMPTIGESLELSSL